MVSSSASESLADLMNGKAGLSPDIFSPAGGGAGPFVRFLFKPFSVVLVLDFIFHIKKRIASNITVPQLVNCCGTGGKSDY